MAEWIDLFDGATTAGWDPVCRGEDEWQTAASVQLDPDDPRTFHVDPGNGVLVNNGRTANIASETLHGDCELHLEFTVPEDSNSGVYLMGKYEIQILDSWEEEDRSYGSCGGIYARWVDEKAVGGRPPDVNASRPPGEWQEYDVLFRAPTFDTSGHKVSNAVFERVEWNGTVVHEGVEVKGPTRAAMPGPEWPRGPLMLQGDHGPVAYRNVRLRKREGGDT